MFDAVSSSLRQPVAIIAGTCRKIDRVSTTITDMGDLVGTVRARTMSRTRRRQLILRQKRPRLHPVRCSGELSFASAKHDTIHRKPAGAAHGDHAEEEEHEGREFE